MQKQVFKCLVIVSEVNKERYKMVKTPLEDMLKIKKENGMTSYILDWEEAVLTPFKSGNFKEAFSMADSLIDSEIESLLREIYQEWKCQDLINEINYLRGRVNFDGLILAEILKSKTVINDTLLERIRNFKKARNLVLHNFEDHYKLIKLSESKDMKDEEYQEVAKKEASLWIDEALNIWTELSLKFREIKEKEKDYYLSLEFYKANPRIKLMEKGHPFKNK